MKDKDIMSTPTNNNIDPYDLELTEEFWSQQKVEKDESLEELEKFKDVDPETMSSMISLA